MEIESSNRKIKKLFKFFEKILSYFGIFEIFFIDNSSLLLEDK